MDEPTTIKCGHCDTAGARLHCTGCKDAPSIDGNPQQTIVYCNKKCQTAHWPTHSQPCKTLKLRRQLFRAGRFSKKICNTFRRNAFDSCVIGVKERNNILWIQEGDYGVEPKLRPVGVYRRFPDELFKNEEDADTVLNALNCCEALALMYPVWDWLLKDISTSIVEVSVGVTKTVRTCRYSHLNMELSDGFRHEVLKIRLKSGETYAIDVSGAQYGWYEPVVDWDKYLENCISAPTNTFGHLNSTLFASCFTYPDLTFSPSTDHQRSIPSVNELMRMVFEKEFKKAIIDRHPKALDLLNLSREAYETAERIILSETEQLVKEAAENIDNLVPLIPREVRHASMELAEGGDTAEVLQKMMEWLLGYYNLVKEERQ